MRTRLSPLFAAAALTALLALPGVASAADLVMQVVGAAQGAINGTCTIHGHENWITLYSFSHGVSVPIGIGGQPSGAPQTSPVSVIALFDRSTVKLMRALANAENLTTWKLEWLDAGTGQAQIRYELQSGHVASVEETGNYYGEAFPTVALTFTYSRIVITDLVQNTTVQYDWNPVTTSTPQVAAKGILLAPSPNPTQGPTEFRFTLPADSEARLALYDLRGYRVRELFSGRTSAEPTVAAWDGTDDSGRRVAQGMYVARLTYPGREVTQRITVLR